MDYISGYIEEKAAGYLTTGINAVGSLAGNAVGGIGDLIESNGQAVGSGECRSKRRQSLY